jgi:hypothetical protein
LIFSLAAPRDGDQQLCGGKILDPAYLSALYLDDPDNAGSVAADIPTS